MKILHITKKYPRALGGDAVVVFNLRRQQQAAGHEVIVLTSNCDEIPNARGVYKFGLPDTAARLDCITPRRLISLFMLFFSVFALLRKERPDVIHTHSVDLAFVVSAAARFYGIPIIHTFHIVTFYDAHHSAFRRKVELWLARSARPRATTVPNLYDAGKLRQAGLSQTVVLPNGVDLSFWQAVSRQESEAFTFLAVGRLEHQKGYEHLIRATALLTQTLPVPVRVLIAGDGSERERLQKLIRSQGLEGTVRLVGRKSPEQIRTLLARASAAVFPSLYETTPVTVLEAWAAKVPVVVSSVGILRDAPADFAAAYVVPPADEVELSRAMARCITDAGTRQEVAENGYQEAAKYTWPVIAQTAESLYRNSTS